MKYLLFIVLLLTVVMTAGCVGGNKTTIVTPTQIIPTPTVVQPQDPIIGVWRQEDKYSDFRLRFNADGTFIGSLRDGSGIMVDHGTWSAQNDNSYKLYFLNSGITYTWVHDAIRNTIYDSRYPDNPSNLLTPYKGDVEAASSPPTSSATYSSQSSSSGSTHLSGSGDDVQSFTATGTGLIIFTMSHTGSSNFAIWLKDSSGKEIALLVNEIGSYSGKKSERLTSGTYYLDITADGSWTIDISTM
jgi:hypothetical protein